MRTRVAVLADYANIAEQGKLNVMGIFSILFAPVAPVIHPQMQLVTQFEFEPSEVGEKDVKFVLLDEDGREHFRLGVHINVQRNPNGLATLANQILVINGAKFPRFGSYEFHILIGETLAAEIPLEVTQIQTTPPAALQG
ncbi:MAG: hypothetical protein HY327_03460 [Chloroflexi bacterium]|nr:hypothetical protein [Chloroflexota bacterium]